MATPEGKAEFASEVERLTKALARAKAKAAHLEGALAESLDQQAATTDILRLISGSQAEIQPVLDAVAASASRLCEAEDTTIFRLEGDRLLLVAHHGPITADPVGEFSLPRERGTVAGRTVLDRCTIHVANMQTATREYPAGAHYAKQFGHRAMLSVPLLKDGAAIGVIQLRRNVARRFSDRQVALLQTFAEQAVIAIENVRLFREAQARNTDLAEALERQTATAAILNVISGSPTDVQPVFETIIENAVRLCGGFTGAVFRYDGEQVHFAAGYELTPGALEGYRRRYPRSLDRDRLLAPAILEGRPHNVPDVLEFVRSAVGQAELGFRSALYVPILREGAAIGVIAVGRREVGPFPDAQIALLQTFADQAVIAIEN
ncbi:MAG TPA: GAF domain-containing protein, partial [Myxococcaceae bacterium]|nr:GAF domain-containing protein [Myxococcaceae bacterium]